MRNSPPLRPLMSDKARSAFLLAAAGVCWGATVPAAVLIVGMIVHPTRGDFWSEGPAAWAFWLLLFPAVFVLGRLGRQSWRRWRDARSRAKIG